MRVTEGILEEMDDWTTGRLDNSTTPQLQCIVLEKGVREKGVAKLEKGVKEKGVT